MEYWVEPNQIQKLPEQLPPNWDNEPFRWREYPRIESSPEQGAKTQEMATVRKTAAKTESNEYFEGTL